MARNETTAAFRCAEPGDADAIDRLICYLDAFHAQARPDMFRAPTGKPRGDDFLARVLEDPFQTLLVAEQAGQVVGYVHVCVKQTPASSYKIGRRFGEIDSLAVLPQVQRLGLGRKLIQDALEWLSRQGVDDHQIAVHAFNDSALRLYQRCGFAPSVVMLRRRDISGTGLECAP
jgi:ribosomal protein S18 acetylase RimI-like enzyme